MQEVEAPTISIQSAQEGGDVVSPTHAVAFTSKISLLLIYVGG